VSVVEASRRGLRRLGRYLVTNGHTSLLFWGPVGLLLFLQPWLPSPLAWPLIAAVAVHQHVRTTLAPYAAVHGLVHPTRATIRAWQLAGTHFWALLAVLGVSLVPVGLPLVALYAITVWLGPQSLSAELRRIDGQLFAVLLQALRPLLIPALYRCYEDVWQVNPVEQPGL